VSLASASWLLQLQWCNNFILFYLMVMFTIISVGQMKQWCQTPLLGSQQIHGTRLRIVSGWSLETTARTFGGRRITRFAHVRCITLSDEAVHFYFSGGTYLPLPCDRARSDELRYILQRCHAVAGTMRPFTYALYVRNKQGRRSRLIGTATAITVQQ
jgi:hypothetical protein